jgi:hypothetical protein
MLGWVSSRCRTSRLEVVARNGLLQIRGETYVRARARHIRRGSRCRRPAAGGLLVRFAGAAGPWLASRTVAGVPDSTFDKHRMDDVACDGFSVRPVDRDSLYSPFVPPVHTHWKGTYRRETRWCSLAAVRLAGRRSCCLVGLPSAARCAVVCGPADKLQGHWGMREQLSELVLQQRKCGGRRRHCITSHGGEHLPAACHPSIANVRSSTRVGDFGRRRTTWSQSPHRTD